MMFWYGAHMALWQASLMWAGTIVFWAVVIWAVYALINARRNPPRSDDLGEAHRILDQRLARGELDPAEYQRLRDLISSSGQHEQAGNRTAR